jgi:hypothetical protein
MGEGVSESPHPALGLCYRLGLRWLRVPGRLVARVNLKFVGTV